jgi:hypothetical protein
MIRGVIAGAAMLAACTQAVQLDDHLGGLVALDVTPAQATIAITDLGQPARTLPYTATGQFADGSTRDVTAYVNWSVDDPAPGMFTQPGTYTTSNAAAGHVVVTATSNAIVGTAALTVTVTATIVDPAFPPPGDPGTLFPPGAPIITGDAMRSPSLSYPSHGTVFPQGVSRTLFQFARGMQNDALRVALDNDVLHLIVYTGADRWSADGATWSLIAASGTSSPVQVVITGATSTGAGTLYGSAPVSLAFSRDAPGGSIYYWSAATTAVMRGSLDAEIAGRLYPSSGTCVGCHAASRDGRQLALGYGGEILQTIALPSLATVISAGAKPMGWAAYSPDGRRLLVANKGQLALYDATTGAPIGSPDGHVHLPPMMFATHPDWSPDGASVTVAVTAMAPTNMDVRSASIAVLPFAKDHFGPAQVIVAAAGMENNYFPRWSPDGRWLAYVHAIGTSHGALTAELWLVPASGGSPVALGIASHRVASLDGVPNLADTMPAWAPVTGDHAWLAFASARPYGAVLPSGGTAQIWIAAVAPQAGEGDPSSAAFWLPCQDVTALENNPAWAPAIGSIGGASQARPFSPGNDSRPARTGSR